MTSDVCKSSLGENYELDLDSIDSSSLNDCCDGPVYDSLFLGAKALIGSGSSRNVYINNSVSVLKVAKNRSGIIQNFNEVTRSKTFKSKYLPKIYAHSNDYLWVMSELLIPIDFNFSEKIEDFGSPAFTNELSKFHLTFFKNIANICSLVDEIGCVEFPEVGYSGTGQLKIMDYGYDSNLFNRN